MGQGEHYDAILGDCQSHYYDATSRRYRRRYIYSTMFDGLDLISKRIAELACRSGFNSLEVLRRFPNADVFGLDIFPRLVEAYHNRVGKPGYVCDLSAPNVDIPVPADAAFVMSVLAKSLFILDDVHDRLLARLPFPTFDARRHRHCTGDGATR